MFLFFRVKNPFPKLLMPLLVLNLASCSGPGLQAKAANTIQTLLAYSAEALLLNGGGQSITQNCSAGGNFSFDASSLPAIIDQNVVSPNISVQFNDCKFKICNDIIHFKNSTHTTNFKITGLNLNDLERFLNGDSLLEIDDQFFEIDMLIQNQEVSGFLEGSLSFGYKMRLIGNEKGLKGIQIIDSQRAEPLKIQNKTLPASHLQTLSERC